MTEKIFEYKDDKDWYVGKLEGDGFNFFPQMNLTRL